MAEVKLDRDKESTCRTHGIIGNDILAKLPLHIPYIFQKRVSSLNLMHIKTSRVGRHDAQNIMNFCSMDSASHFTSLPMMMSQLFKQFRLFNTVSTKSINKVQAVGAAESQRGDDIVPTPSAEDKNQRL